MIIFIIVDIILIIIISLSSLLLYVIIIIIIIIIIIAVSAPLSGDWLHALPISSCGLRLDDEAFRVALELHLGVRLCEPISIHTAPWSVPKALTALPADVLPAERLVTTF